MKNISSSKASSSCGGLVCSDCRTISIFNSVFQNINSTYGGAIYIEESDSNKRSTDSYGKYVIKDSLF